MSEQPFEDPLFASCVDYFQGLQSNIIEALEALDPANPFVVDDWKRPPLPPIEDTTDAESPVLSGWGRTRVLEDGAVFEKAGVNFSDVHGYFPESYASTMPGGSRAFRASGVSLVLHPKNPHVPTVHMNVRRITRGDKSWFGGGADLTPYYLGEDDAAHFHRTLRDACGAHPSVGDYPAMKNACDEYFYIPHRKEARGVGGIFFDYLGEDPDATFAFVREVGDAFLPAYLPLVERRNAQPWTEQERDWQLYRRGRYVEFNLVYDRGTTFGLKTGGRIESILMSLPLNVRWQYDRHPEPDSPEAALLKALVPRDWA